MQNPFTLTFGRSPLESVDRPVQINEIIENFTADTINQQMFIITGVRGSGKTVMMTEISHKLRENDDWVVIELNPATDLLSAMLSKKAKHVYGIEINKSAHFNAENLKKCNKISNLTNICGDFFEKYKKFP